MAVTAYVATDMHSRKVGLFMMVTNEGRNAIWIARWRCKFKREYREGSGFGTVLPEGDSELPKQLAPGRMKR